MRTISPSAMDDLGISPRARPSARLAAQLYFPFVEAYTLPRELVRTIRANRIRAFDPDPAFRKPQPAPLLPDDDLFSVPPGRTVEVPDEDERPTPVPLTPDTPVRPGTRGRRTRTKPPAAKVPVAKRERQIIEFLELHGPHNAEDIARHFGLCLIRVRVIVNTLVEVGALRMSKDPAAKPQGGRPRHVFSKKPAEPAKRGSSFGQRVPPRATPRHPGGPRWR